MMSGAAMAERIDVAAIRAAHPILAVVAAAGVELSGTGRRRLGRCPFHEDRAPSLVVYPVTASYFCFGCGAGGDVVDFVGRLQGTGFRETAARLAATVPATAGGDGAVSHRSPPPRQRPPDTRLTAVEAAVIETAVAHAAAALIRHDAARRYLAARGIDDATARALRLGVAAGGLAAVLQRRGLDRAVAGRLGLLAGTRERFAGRILVPDLDGCGRARWFTGRALHLPSSGNEAPRYLNLRRPAPLLGLAQAAAARAGTVVVVEGPFDWLTARAWGLPAVALLGTHVSTPALGSLRRFRRVVLALDADDPGQRAAQALAAALGDRATVVALPGGAHDLNDLGRRPGGRAAFDAALAAVLADGPTDVPRAGGR